MPGTAEYRMVRDLVLDVQAAEPPIRKVHLHLGAEPALRAEREHVADNQHPDHQLRIDRGPAGVGVIRLQLLVHPAEVENAVDPAHQMISRNHIVEMKLVE